MRLPLNFTLLWQLLKTNENEKKKKTKTVKQNGSS